MKASLPKWDCASRLISPVVQREVVSLKSLFDFIQTGGTKVFDAHQLSFGTHGQITNGADAKKLKCFPSPHRKIQA